MARPGGFASAKINLALHVTGQRADGLHLLDSLVAFADVGDRLEAELAGQTGLTVTGPMAQGVPTDDSNLVIKAANWMGVPARFTLEKHLPAAAGIGGGSSDAAAALRLLADLSGQPIPPGSETLGADIPVCLMARAAWMRGIGEQVTPVDLPPLPCLLVNPGVDVSTGAVFAGLEQKENPGLADWPPMARDPRGIADWLSRQRNDLERPARIAEPVVAQVLQTLADLDGALLARMSGSGATCFALFNTLEAASAAETALRTARPEWWIAATTLR